MAGLDPAIHVFDCSNKEKDVDAQVILRESALRAFARA
jgi:hypothetical protein